MYHEEKYYTFNDKVVHMDKMKLHRNPFGKVSYLYIDHFECALDNLNKIIYVFYLYKTLQKSVVMTKSVRECRSYLINI